MHIPVGTALAGGPPDRSQRAGLPHWAPTSGTSGKARLGKGVLGPGRRKPSSREAVHAPPVRAATLAAAREGVVPVPGHPGAEARYRGAIARHGVVGEVPSHNRAEPTALFGNGLVPTTHQL